MTGGSHTELRRFVVALALGALALVGGCSTSETTPPPTKVTTAPGAEVAPKGGVALPGAGATPPSQPAGSTPGQATTPDPETLATCEDVAGAYGRLVSNRSCTSDSDCQLLAGSCGVGLGGCAEAVNASVEPAQLGALAARWSALGCTGGVCRCMEPGSPRCQNGLCEEAVRTR